jgi:hypothetical protein
MCTKTLLEIGVTIESSLSNISFNFVQTIRFIAADVPAGWENMDKHNKMMIDENRRERLQCLESRIRDNR